MCQIMQDASAEMVSVTVEQERRSKSIRALYISYLESADCT